MKWYYFVSHIDIREDNQGTMKCLGLTLFRTYVFRTSVLQCRLQGTARHARGLKSPSPNGMAQVVSISAIVRIKDYGTILQIALLTHRGKNWTPRQRTGTTLDAWSVMRLVGQMFKLL